MAIEFYAPEWTFAPPSPPEPPEPPSANSLSIPDEAYGASTAYAIDPTLPLGPNDWDEADRANAARVDELNNEFIDLRNGILHDGDDAFFNRTGRDAILAAPEVHAKLEAARQETLARAANDVQRQWLAETLGKHKTVEHFDIADHAGRQSVEWQKAVNRGRLDRLNQQAGRDHADPKMVEALANASESSARDHARASGHKADSPEAQAEVDIARSSVFRHAIEGALAEGAYSTAIKLHDRAKDKLVPGDAELLDKIIEDAREMEVGKAYVAKIAPLSLTISASLEDLNKAETEATAKNNADWKNNDTQRLTNQHLIDIQFGEDKQKIEEDKAELTRTVYDWLTKPGPNGRLRTGRPPLTTWAKLSLEEQKGVDGVLKLNTHNPAPSEHPGLIEAKTPTPEVPEPPGPNNARLPEAKQRPPAPNLGRPTTPRPPVPLPVPGGRLPVGLSLASILALLLITPLNDGIETIDLGNGLRARRRYGDAEVSIEKREAGPLGIGEWKAIRTKGRSGPEAGGEQMVLLDPDELERELGKKEVARLAEHERIVLARPGDRAREEKARRFSEKDWERYQKEKSLRSDGSTPPGGTSLPPGNNNPPPPGHNNPPSGPLSDTPTPPVAISPGKPKLAPEDDPDFKGWPPNDGFEGEPEKMTQGHLE